MVVIVASLFLPFQPQFEINASEVDTAALAESQPIKVHNAGSSSKNALSGLSASITAVGSNAVDTGPALTRKRSSSTHSRSSIVPLDLAMSSSGLDHNEQSPTPSCDSQHRAVDNSKTTIANPQISSELFMESLTANASNTGMMSATPVNPISNHASASVEEFFSIGNSGMARNYEPTGSPDSNLSIQSSPVISSSNLHQDSTTNLLKNVNKSLLYQTVLNESNSSSALEGTSHFFRNSPGSMVITPRSRVLPEMNNTLSSLAKAKNALQKQSQVPAIRHVHRKSSGAAGGNAPLGSSNLKFSVKASEAAAQYPLNDSDSDLSDADFDDVDELDGSDRFHYFVPKFGGYSNNAKLRNYLLKSSQNIFASAPWCIVPCAKGNGGLKNAISTALIEKTIEESVTWVGTVGIPTDSIPNTTLDKIKEELSTNFHSKAVITDDLTFKGAYKNYCKQILWPTLHYQIPDNSNSKAFEDHSWSYYQYLNQLFADEIISTYKDGDVIWINDYHLMLVPEMIRNKLPDAKIGFFLHISFPSSEVFRCFPQREKILKGILGANSVGFQTEEYARHFMQTTTRLLMTDVDDHQLKLQGRIVKVNSNPIGIDVFNLDEQINTEQVIKWRRLIRERWYNKRLIVCRDQFDRIRGLKKKMLAYERFLKENPEYIDQVVMIQICLDTARDVELEREVMSVVDRINALSKDISISQPVVFLHQDLEFSQYLALSCEADLFIVSSMREGMNLTCHEFVVCSREKNSPLLLSEFTGSTQILRQGALLINPWDIRSFAQAIKKGLELSPEEKRRRWKNMFKNVITHDSDNWILQSLSHINSSWEFNHERSQVFNLSYEHVHKSFLSSKRHMFLLKISEPPTPRMLKILSDLSANNIVYIMNSHSRTVLERHYSRVSNLGLIAENGAYVTLNGNWFNTVDDVSWKEDVIKVIEDKVERLPGSYCKIGDSMVRFHTENAEDKERISSVIGEAMTHINTLFGDKGIHAYVHKNIVFVQQVGLALKTLQFLLNYYNSVDDTSSSTPSSRQSSIGSPLLSPVTSQSGKFTHLPPKKEANQLIDFLSVTGSSSPVLEPLFHYVNQQVKKEKLDFGFTIVHGDTSSSYAKEHVKGLNELFTILQNLASSKDD